MLIKTIRKTPYGRVLLVDCTTARVLHKIASPNSCTVIQNRKASLFFFFFTFHNKWTQSHAGDCFLSKFGKKKKRKEKSNCASKSLFIVEHRNPLPALLKLVALREYKNIQSGRKSWCCLQHAVYKWYHWARWPHSIPPSEQAGIDVRSSILERPPVSDTHTHTRTEYTWVYPSGSPV